MRHLIKEMIEEVNWNITWKKIDLKVQNSVGATFRKDLKHIVVIREVVRDETDSYVY